MRRVLFFAATTLGSIAFQVSIALWPQYLRQYAWAVKYIWIAWAICLCAWLLFYLFAKHILSPNTQFIPATPISDPAPEMNLASRIAQNASPTITQSANP